MQSSNSRLQLTHNHPNRINHPHHHPYQGAEVTNKRSDGITALMAASVGGHFKTVKLLVERGAVIDEKDQVCERGMCVYIYIYICVCVSNK